MYNGCQRKTIKELGHASTTLYVSKAITDNVQTGPGPSHSHIAVSVGVLTILLFLILFVNVLLFHTIQ